MADMETIPQLSIRLYGVFAMTLGPDRDIRVRSLKLRALIATLATAPEGRRTRAWLQDLLWSRSGHEHGRASLRRALTDLRRLFGEEFATYFEADNAEVRLFLDRVSVVGTPADGTFLEGLDIAEEGFEDWLRQQRQTSGQPRRQGVAGVPGMAAAAPIASLLPLNDPDTLRLRPSLAILPFAPARGHDGPEQLGDMLSEELSRALSRSHMLDVISHLSCRNLDTRVVDLAGIRGALDADYVVCGSYRTRGDSVLVYADFIDSKSGRIGMTREVAASLRAFLRGEEELVLNLAGEIGRAVTDTSVELARLAPLQDVDTHALLMSGVTLMHRVSVASFSQAKKHLEEVARRAPRNSQVHAWMAKWYVLSVVQGWSSDLENDARQAADHTARALDLRPDCSFSLSIDGLVHNNLMHELDTSMERFKEAIEIDPNNALAWLLKGTLHAFRDEGQLAVTHCSRARALSPIDPHKYYYDSLAAAASLANGDYQRALELSKLSLRANRRHASTLRAQIVALQMLGRIKEAQVCGEELLRADPSFTVRGYMRAHPAASYAVGQSWAQALREAGLPA